MSGIYSIQYNQLTQCLGFTEDCPICRDSLRNKTIIVHLNNSSSPVHPTCYKCIQTATKIAGNYNINCCVCRKEINTTSIMPLKTKIIIEVKQIYALIKVILKVFIIFPIVIFLILCVLLVKLISRISKLIVRIFKIPFQSYPDLPTLPLVPAVVTQEPSNVVVNRNSQIIGDTMDIVNRFIEALM